MAAELAALGLVSITTGGTPLGEAAAGDIALRGAVTPDPLGDAGVGVPSAVEYVLVMVRVVSVRSRCSNSLRLSSKVRLAIESCLE